MADHASFNFPRWFPMRGYGGGGMNYGVTGNALSSLGGDIGAMLDRFAQARQRKQQDELANALMNNGQGGAAPWVRRATRPDGSLGPAVGPVPFASVDQPYTGGMDQQQMLAQALAQQGGGGRSRGGGRSGGGHRGGGRSPSREDNTYGFNEGDTGPTADSMFNTRGPNRGYSRAAEPVADAESMPTGAAVQPESDLPEQEGAAPMSASAFGPGMGAPQSPAAPLPNDSDQHLAAPAGPKMPMNADEYAAIPVGAQYIDPGDKKLYVKK